jgi:ribosomal protein S18 acetylase RimI-like enzyme
LIKIIKAETHHTSIIKEIGVQSFIESHGHSASEEDINTFLRSSFDIDVIQRELSDAGNVYHIIFYEGMPAGYSKIKYNQPNPSIDETNITKMERLYLLKQFYGKGLGEKLMNFNINIAQNEQQVGLWLYVWVENIRAYTFYQKSGFHVVGHYDYIISENHTNPNYIMYKNFIGNNN